MAQIFEPMLLGPWIATDARRMVNLSSKMRQEDLVTVEELIEAGKVVAVERGDCPPGEIAEAERPD